MHIRRTTSRTRPVPSARPVVALVTALLSLLVLALATLFAAVPAGAQTPPTLPTTTAAPDAGGASTTTATSLTASSGAPLQAKAGPGDILVSQNQNGLVSVITSGEQAKIAVDGLVTPTGLATLDDGSILIAERQPNRISGIGGRFPERLTKLVELADPYALGVSPDGALYVTQLSAGKVSQLDLKTFALVPVGEGISSPTAVTGHDGDVFVAEAGTNKIIRISTKDGTKSDYATDIGTPNGLTFGPDGSLYVSDFVGNRIIKVDPSGTHTDFAKVDGPKQLAIDPVKPKVGDDFQIVAATMTGITQYKPDGTVEAQVPFSPDNSAVGVAVAAGGLPPTATPTGTTPTIVPTTSRSATGIGGTQVAQPDAGSGNGTLAFLVLFIAIALIVAVAIAGYSYSNRSKRTEEYAGFSDLDESAVTMTQAMGPCAAEEVELAEAEDTKRQVVGQRHGAEARLADAQERADRARRREAESRSKAEALRLQRKGAQAHEPDAEGEDDDADEPPKLSLAELGLTTEAGRAALQAFGRGELNAVDLRERWEELGEHTAVAAVQGQSEKIARTTPWPEEREAALSADQAQLELEQAERDGADASADIERLTEREQQLVERIETARVAVDDCHKRQRLVDEEAASAAASALADLQIASDLAVAKDKEKGKGPAAPPPPPAPATDDQDAEDDGRELGDAEVDGDAAPPFDVSGAFDSDPFPRTFPPPHVGRPKAPTPSESSAETDDDEDDTGRLDRPVVPPVADAPAEDEKLVDADVGGTPPTDALPAIELDEAAPVLPPMEPEPDKGKGRRRGRKARRQAEAEAAAQAAAAEPPSEGEADDAPADADGPAGAPPPSIQELLEQRRADEAKAAGAPGEADDGSTSDGPSGPVGGPSD